MRFTNRSKSSAAPGTALRFGIQDKLFLLVLISFALLTALIVIFVDLRANFIARDSATRSLDRAEKVLQARLGSRFDEIERTARSLAVHGRARPLVYFSDSKSLQDLSVEFKRSYGFYLLIITDAAGKVLARSDNPEAAGTSVAESSLFRKALEGESAYGTMKTKDTLLQIVTVPIVDNSARDIVRGSLGLAYEISPSILREIALLTENQISLFSLESGENTEAPMPRLLSTTDDSLALLLDSSIASQPALLRELRSGRFETRGELFSASDQFLSLFYPLRAHDGRATGFVVALRSLTEVKRPFRQIQQGTIIIGVLVLLTGILVAIQIARRIATPITALVDVTNDIAQGIYTRELPPPRGDEVGVLEQAIFRMAQDLRKKNELEAYLASLAEMIHPVSGETGIHASRSTINLSRVTADTVGLDGEPFAVLEPGHVFDKRYEIKRILGQGGMGIVYLAEDQQLDELVAIKILDQALSTGEMVEALRKETKLARRITHPNILRTHDFGMSEGMFYISMEFVEGYTLFQLIYSKGPLTPQMGVRLLQQICAALTAAHRQGIVHRDLKAENVIINRRGAVKIMDFGISTMIDTPIVNADGTIQYPEKKASSLSGTPIYMSPEQILGDSIDQRVDIYALGVLTFYLLTGRFPFKEGSSVEIFAQHLRAAPRKLRDVSPNLPAELERIVEKCLAKNPAERYSVASEINDALAQIH